MVVSDWQVARQLGSWPWPPDPAYTASRARPFTGDGFVWGAFGEGRLLGTVGVTEGGLGYSFRLALAGQGLATAVVARAVDHAFAAGTPEIRAGAWADNAASIRVLEKLGFRRIGAGRELARARGEETASIDFALPARDWRGLRPDPRWTIAVDNRTESRT